MTHPTTPDSRESELREIWAQECERHGAHQRAKNVRNPQFEADLSDSEETKAALAAMRRISDRRISTPLKTICKTCKGIETIWDGEFHIRCPECAPLTPSDEMVYAAMTAWYAAIPDDGYHDCDDCNEKAMKAALQAALNLMGGKK